MLARGALGAAVGAQMRLHVTLCQGVQAAQDLRGHRLQARHDEQQMIGAVELAGGGELPRGGGLVEPGQRGLRAAA